MNELRKTQTCQPLERPEDARCHKTRALYGYWQGLQAAGKPTRAMRAAAGCVIASYERAILPLWRGEDPAGSFVAIEVYDGIDSHRIPDWTKVTLKDDAAR